MAPPGALKSPLWSAGARAGHHLSPPGPPIRGHDEEDRLADRLGRRVAEELLGRPVPRRDGAVQRLADDRVVGRFHDGSESRRRRLTDPFLHRDPSWWMIARTAGGPARQRSVTAEAWHNKPRRP